MSSVACMWFCLIACFDYYLKCWPLAICSRECEQKDRERGGDSPINWEALWKNHKINRSRTDCQFAFSLTSEKVHKHTIVHFIQAFLIRLSIRVDSVYILHWQFKNGQFDLGLWMISVIGNIEILNHVCFKRTKVNEAKFSNNIKANDAADKSGSHANFVSRKM